MMLFMELSKIIILIKKMSWIYAMIARVPAQEIGNAGWMVERVVISVHPAWNSITLYIMV